jgi:hypothetical protein
MTGLPSPEVAPAAPPEYCRPNRELGIFSDPLVAPPVCFSEEVPPPPQPCRCSRCMLCPEELELSGWWMQELLRVPEKGKQRVKMALLIPLMKGNYLIALKWSI